MKEPPLLTNGHAVVFVLGLILGALGAGRVDTWLDDHRGYIGVQADGSTLIRNITFEGVDTRAAFLRPIGTQTCLLSDPPICPGDRR